MIRARRRTTSAVKRRVTARKQNIRKIAKRFAIKRNIAAKRRTGSRINSAAYNKGFDEGFDESYNGGFSAGYEEGVKQGHQSNERVS